MATACFLTFTVMLMSFCVIQGPLELYWVGNSPRDCRQELDLEWEVSLLYGGVQGTRFLGSL